MVVDASAMLELVRRMEQDASYLSAAVLALHGLFEVVASDMLAYELANVVSSPRHLEVEGDFTVRERLLRLLLADTGLVPIDRDAALRILSVSVQNGLTAYDAAYLELAMRDPTSALVTEDRRLLKAAETSLGSDRAFTVGALGGSGSPYRVPFVP